MAELGYFGLIFPPEYGGMGLDTLSMAIVTEELSRGWLSVGSVMTRMLITGTLIMAQRHRGAEEEVPAQDLLAASCSPPPPSPSPTSARDTASMKLRAEKDGDQYKLYGEKTWCTFANRAHVLTVAGAHQPRRRSRKHKGLSLLLVEKEPGDGFHPPELARQRRSRPSATRA